MAQGMGEDAGLRTVNPDTRLSVSTPYRENSIVNIAQTAAEYAGLRRFYTTLYLAQWQATARRVPIAGPLLEKELGRRGFRGIPPGLVDNVAMVPELAQIATRRLLGQRRANASADLMYWSKARFDAAVASRLDKETAGVLVGMYAASLESFRTIHRQGGLTVLNFVNSHPAEHNRYLVDLAGLKVPHHELIPDWVTRRVEAELELADLVLAPSRFVAGQLVAHGVSLSKIATLPYGVDLGAFHPSEQRARAQRTLECLYVGQISYRKGINVLLEAARRCEGLPVRFRLVGPVVSREVLDGLPDNVVYEGTSLPGGVADAMRRADLFVLPTIEDSFALVVFEAMATALPVVTTTHAGASELIEDGLDGLIVPPGNAEALAESIGRLVEQPELRHRLGEAAYQKVQGAHSWEAYGKSVLAAIEACRKGILTGSGFAAELP